MPVSPRSLQDTAQEFDRILDMLQYLECRRNGRGPAILSPLETARHQIAVVQAATVGKLKLLDRLRTKHINDRT